jgi:hypothetical protein
MQAHGWPALMLALCSTRANLLAAAAASCSLLNFTLSMAPNRGLHADFFGQIGNTYYGGHTAALLLTVFSTSSHVVWRTCKEIGLMLQMKATPYLKAMLDQEGPAQTCYTCAST